MRTLASFADLSKRTADANNDFRGDTLEGISESFTGGFNPYGYSSNNGKPIPDGTIGVVDALTYQKKVFCLYALEYDHIRKCFIKPSEKLRSFGDTAVVITDVVGFLQRVDAALSKKYEFPYWRSCKRVQYNVNMNGDFQYNEFCKSYKYAWQNEFRISLDLSDGKFHPEILEDVTDFAKFNFLGKIEVDSREDSTCDSLVLSLDDISDICIEMPVSELLMLDNPIFNNAKEKCIIPQNLTNYEKEPILRSTFIKRICRFSDGRLGFTTKWLDAKNY